MSYKQYNRQQDPVFLQQQSNRSKWTLEDEERMVNYIKQNYEDKQIAWQQVAVYIGKKTQWSCYNKYLQLNDKPWSKQDENKLGQYYEKNRSRPKFNVSEFGDVIKNHNIKMVMFKLEQITRWGRFKPKFWIPREELEKVN